MTPVPPPEFGPLLAGARLLVAYRSGHPVPPEDAAWVARVADQVLPLPALTPAYFDQLGAATDETRRLILDHARATGGGPLREYPVTSPLVDEQLARLLVATIGVDVCAHLRRTPTQPAVVRLPLHRVDCQRCARTVRRPPVDEADRCDWCGARGVEVFCATSGPNILNILVLGDACVPCARVIGDDDTIPEGVEP